MQRGMNGEGRILIRENGGSENEEISYYVMDDGSSYGSGSVEGGSGVVGARGGLHRVVRDGRAAAWMTENS